MSLPVADPAVNPGRTPECPHCRRDGHVYIKQRLMMPHGYVWVYRCMWCQNEWPA